MKSVIYFLGLVAAIGISLGGLFKVLHWQGADQIGFYSFLFLFLIFLPFYAYQSLKNNTTNLKTYKFQIFSGLASGVILGLSVMFKVLHLQGADVLLALGIFLFSFVFLPLFFYKLYKAK